MIDRYLGQRLTRRELLSRSTLVAAASLPLFGCNTQSSESRPIAKPTVTPLHKYAMSQLVTGATVDIFEGNFNIGYMVNRRLYNSSGRSGIDYNKDALTEGLIVRSETVQNLLDIDGGAVYFSPVRGRMEGRAVWVAINNPETWEHIFRNGTSLRDLTNQSWIDMRQRVIVEEVSFNPKDPWQRPAILARKFNGSEIHLAVSSLDKVFGIF